MDRFGWVNINDFCDVMRKRYNWMRKEYLYALVESDEKGRYEIRDSRIRARYGTLSILIWITGKAILHICIMGQA